MTLLEAAPPLTTTMAAATAVAAVALAAGPARTFARRYLSRLEAPGDALEAPGTERADGPPRPPQVRGRWLLDPLPQAALAALLATATLAWGLRAGAPGETVLTLPAVSLLASACSVDAVCHRLPNRLLGAAAAWLAAATVVAGAAYLLATSLTDGGPASHSPWPALRSALWPVARALLCALAAGGAVLVLALLPSGLGLGDVKLSAVLGLWLGRLGAGAAATGLVLGFLLGGAAASLLVLTRRAGRKDNLALGPYLGAGGWLSWLLSLG